MDPQALERLDEGGLTIVDAIAHVRAAPDGSLATPHLFVTGTGKSCWLKKNSQHGLFAELIGGRLAARVGAGPLAHIVDVPTAAITGVPDAAHFVGRCMGTEDLANTENSKFLQQKNIVLTPGMIDKDQRALVVAFQTWVHLGDHQVMVDLATGLIYSHDHGELFPPGGLPGDMPVMVSPLNGVDARHGCDQACIDRAVARVESCSDEELLRAVANVPDEWGADRAHRLAVAEWLAIRRGQLREVMASW